jgi:hypothetical protein
MNIYSEHLKFLAQAIMESELSLNSTRTSRSSSLSSLSSSKSDRASTANVQSQDWESTPSLTPTPRASSNGSQSALKQAISGITVEKDPENKRARTSWIYNHGHLVEKEGGDGTRYWQCGLCCQAPYKATTTNSSGYHLKKAHKSFKGDPNATSTSELLRLGSTTTVIWWRRKAVMGHVTGNAVFAARHPTKLLLRIQASII